MFTILYTSKSMICTDFYPNPNSSSLKKLTIVVQRRKGFQVHEGQKNQVVKPKYMCTRRS